MDHLQTCNELDDGTSNDGKPFKNDKFPENQAVLGKFGFGLAIRH